MTYHYSFIDKLLMGVQGALDTCFVQTRAPGRNNPAETVSATPLSKPELRRTVGAMRVNHAGEIAAQGLYVGQAMSARTQALAKQMQKAADEEMDHLIWCQQRLAELNSKPSHLALLWYMGALSMGLIAGIVGDKWNLGFLMETEYQVMQHLQNHQQLLSANDLKSQRIVEQMILDEAEHAYMAKRSGAENLPVFVKKLMKSCAKVMTSTAYWV